MNPSYVVLVVVGVTLLVTEILVRRRRRMAVDLRETGISLRVGLIAYSTGGFAQLLVATIAFLGISHAAPWHLPVWDPLTWLAYIALDDFAGYWSHRASHRYRFLWSAHLVHHSSSDFTMANAVRLSPIEALYQPLVNLWAPFLGFPVAIYAPLTVLSLLLAQLQHTRVIGRLGRLDRWVNTPSNHRVHHGKNAACIDKNFGGWTMLWDRLFGTYVAEHEEPVYGVTDTLRAPGVFGTAAGGYPALVGDMRRAGRASGVLRTALARPGRAATPQRQPYDPAYG